MAEHIDIAVVGGGPAGLAAGLYAARGMAKTVIFERAMPGGQIVTTDWVENYPGFPKGLSGAELGSLLAEQAEEHGADEDLRPPRLTESLAGDEHLDESVDHDADGRAEEVQIAT